MIDLRPHQERGVELLREGFRVGHLRQLLAMRCGAGKTITAASVALSAKAKGNVTPFIVDRIELAAQAADTMQRVGLTVSIMQGENTNMVTGHGVIVASIQTLARRRFPDARLIVIDEAHVLHQAHIKLLERWNALPVIGLTATPFACGLGRHFTNLVVPTAIRDLTHDGLLVPVVAYGPNKPDLGKL
ncbi:MAG: DEAD/DEAH box helicase family protein [Gammaproteobacteria bacterium]|nr:DEAD/DEAH box helicase family protein [Gammaproteobacteria bacterium]